MWASVVVAPGLQSTGWIVVVQRFSCSKACEIFPDQGSNLCLLHWQANPLPLSHQGSFHSSVIYHSQDTETKCSLVDKWIKKLYIFIRWNIIQSLKNEEIWLFATTWMDLEDIMLSEMSDTYIWNFLFKTLIEKKKIEHMVTRCEGLGNGYWGMWSKGTDF